MCARCPRTATSKCPSPTPEWASRRRIRRRSSRSSARWGRLCTNARAPGSGWRSPESSSSSTGAACGSRARSEAARRSRSRFPGALSMAGELILVVEDNDNNRMLVRDVLQANGYRVAEAENAEDGLRMAVDQKPALILMDIQLPGMNGMDALQRLRADPAT